MPAFDLASELLTAFTSLGALDRLASLPLLVPAGASLALLGGTIAVRRLGARRLAPEAAGPADAGARRRLRFLRGVCALLLLLGLGMLWQSEIHSLALQLAAVVMAIVMAFRELILCATGSILRIGGGLYRIGDIVEIDGTLGEVTDTTLLVTHIAELHVDSFGRHATGRSRALPNSRLFAAELRVDRLGRDFVTHGFSITLPADGDAPRALEILERATARATADFAAAGTDACRAAGQRLHRDLGRTAGMVAMATTEIGLPRFDLRLFCPAGAIHETERAIRLALVRGLAERPARSATAEGLRLVAG